VELTVKTILHSYSYYTCSKYNICPYSFTQSISFKLHHVRILQA